MNNRMQCLKIVFTVLLLLQVFTAKGQTQTIDLSGVWRFQTDVMDFRRGIIIATLQPRVAGNYYPARDYRRL